MTKSESGKKYALVAAICYVVCATYNIINRIIYVSNSDYDSITVLDVLYWIAIIGMAVALFTKKDKILLGAVGINALLGAYYIISYFSYFSLWNLLFSLRYLLNFVSYAALTALLVLALKGNVSVKKIWFVPGAAASLGCLIGWIQYGYFSYISATWKMMFFNVIEIAAIFFIGMWLKESVAPVNAESAEPINEYATFNPQAVYSGGASADALGSADKLKMYKDLLDSGTITQEEFDAKKKQILGL